MLKVSSHLPLDIAALLAVSVAPLQIAPLDKLIRLIYYVAHLCSQLSLSLVKKYNQSNSLFTPNGGVYKIKWFSALSQAKNKKK